jgi:uncharacterized protein YifE (UPF0438 family)
MMSRAKQDLQDWAGWKRTVSLLQETKALIQNTTLGIRYDTDDMPGGNHQSIHQKMARIIEEVEKYDHVIGQYEFLINRLESGINTLLTKDEKEVVIIYANNQTSEKREVEALVKGYSRASYYRILDIAIDKLDKVLQPLDTKLILK